MSNKSISSLIFFLLVDATFSRMNEPSQMKRRFLLPLLPPQRRWIDDDGNDADDGNDVDDGNNSDDVNYVDDHINDDDEKRKYQHQLQ